MKKLFLYSSVLALLVASCQAPSNKTEAKKDSVKTDSVKPHHHDEKWTYEGEKSPEHWKDNPEYAACDGKMQSPIDIIGSVHDFKLKALDFKYQNVTSEKIFNNGHSIQLKVGDGNLFSQHDGDFTLLQFHFHCPSEHLLKGKSFPMEIHLVHGLGDKLAVVGIFVQEGKENPFLAKFWNELPQKVDEEKDLKVELALKDLLPADMKYYNYAGSLTTPPCTEGVEWFVLKTPIEASAEQIAKIKALMPNHNARPVQALNGRPIKDF